MHIVNGTYHVHMHMDEPMPPALCLSALVSRQKVGIGDVVRCVYFGPKTLLGGAHLTVASLLTQDLVILFS